MRRFRLIALLGIVLGGAGCGLPDSYFLLPPAVGLQSATTTSTAEFQINGTDRGTDTGATFQGYELYYKFYGSTGPAGSGASFNSDLTTFGTGSTYVDLQQAGFHRLCLSIGTPVSGMATDTSAGYASAPLVNVSQIDPANIGQSYKIRIKLNDPVTPLFPAPNPGIATLSYYVYVPPSVSTATVYEEVRRFVPLPSASGCKPFASNTIAQTLTPSNITNYNQGIDADLSGGAATAWTEATTGSGNIIVMIYALSYGKSIVDGTPVYSSPVLLGYGGAQILP